MIILKCPFSQRMVEMKGWPWVTKARFWKFYLADANDMPNSPRMGRHSNTDFKNNLVSEFLIERC